MPRPPAAPATPKWLEGIPSDKESVASAVKNSTIIRPGRVATAKGLDIRTVPPKWGIATLRTVMPRNPTMYIVFGRDGRVTHADFLSDGSRTFDTGSEAVNQPLRTAVYSWTAKGKPLEALPENDPDAGITVIVTIILVQ